MKITMARPLVSGAAPSIAADPHAIELASAGDPVIGYVEALPTAADAGMVSQGSLSVFQTLPTPVTDAEVNAVIGTIEKGTQFFSPQISELRRVARQGLEDGYSADEIATHFIRQSNDSLNNLYNLNMYSMTPVVFGYHPDLLKIFSARLPFDLLQRLMLLFREDPEIITPQAKMNQLFERMREPFDAFIKENMAQFVSLGFTFTQVQLLSATFTDMIFTHQRRMATHGMPTKEGSRMQMYPFKYVTDTDMPEVVSHLLELGYTHDQLTRVFLITLYASKVGDGIDATEFLLKEAKEKYGVNEDVINFLVGSIGDLRAMEANVRDACTHDLFFMMRAIRSDLVDLNTLKDVIETVSRKGGGYGPRRFASSGFLLGLTWEQIKNLMQIGCYNLNLDPPIHDYSHPLTSEERNLYAAAAEIYARLMKAHHQLPHKNPHTPIAVKHNQRYNFHRGVGVPRIANRAGNLARVRAMEFVR